MRMIILARVAAGVSTVWMISRERFCIRPGEILSVGSKHPLTVFFGKAPSYCPLPLPLLLHTHTQTHTKGGRRNRWWGGNLAFTSRLRLYFKYHHSCRGTWYCSCKSKTVFRLKFLLMSWRVKKNVVRNVKIKGKDKDKVWKHKWDLSYCPFGVKTKPQYCRSEPKIKKAHLNAAVNNSFSVFQISKTVEYF